MGFYIFFAFRSGRYTEHFAGHMGNCIKNREDLVAEKPRTYPLDREEYDKCGDPDRSKIYGPASDWNADRKQGKYSTTF